MASSINFVADRRKVLTKNQQADARYLKLASVGIVVVCMVYVTALAVGFYYQSAIKKVKQQQDTKRQAILSKEPIEKSYSIFANKLHLLTELYEKRKDKQEALAFFSRLFGSDVEITGLNYTADSNILSFSIRAKNIFIVEQVFAILSESRVTDKYPRVTRNGLSRGPDGSYVMRLTVDIGATADAASGTKK